MKRFLVLAVMILLGVLALHGAVLADDTTTQTTDQQALTLTTNLYCGLKSAFASPTAMFIGLVLAIMGLWQLIQGSVGGGMILIIAGALLSALPSLAESFLSGVGTSIMPLRGTTSSQPALVVPPCP